MSNSGGNNSEEEEPMEWYGEDEVQREVDKRTECIKTDMEKLRQERDELLARVKSTGSEAADTQEELQPPLGQQLSKLAGQKRTLMRENYGLKVKLARKRQFEKKIRQLKTRCRIYLYEKSELRKEEYWAIADRERLRIENDQLLTQRKQMLMEMGGLEKELFINKEHLYTILDTGKLVIESNTEELREENERLRVENERLTEENAWMRKDLQEVMKHASKDRGPLP